MDHRAESKWKQERSDGSTAATPMPCSQAGASQPMQMPRLQSTPARNNCDEDTSVRKRAKVLNGPLCFPVHAQHVYATKQEIPRSDEQFPLRGLGPSDGHGEAAEHCWAKRSASRVTTLYAELVRELETQVAELQQILVSRGEAIAVRELRIQELEKENHELRKQVETLEEQNDVLSLKGLSAINEGGRLLGPKDHNVDVNDNNISFLRSLAAYLEASYNSQNSTAPSISTPPSSNETKSPPHEMVSPHVALPASEADQVHSPQTITSSPPEGMLRLSGVTSGFQYWMKMDDGGENTMPESCPMWEEPLQEILPDGTPAWASPIESNGRPKLELVPASGVYITYQQLEDLSHIPSDKPKLMTRRLLDYFFSRETLARSSATGQRIAHNNTTMEKPLRLPDPVVTAIKAYVTRACGRGCNFNAVINSKCGTSRRAVKKMSVRIDWTEGGTKPCPKPAAISPAQFQHCLNERVSFPCANGTDPPITQNLPQHS